MNLMNIHLRLIDGWHHAWKFSSIRFMALGAAAQTTVLTSDRTGLSAHVPSWMLTGLSMISLACIFLGAAGRITTTEKPNGPSDNA